MICRTFLIVLALSFILIPTLVTEVQADFQTGLNAYEASDYEKAYQELIFEAEEGNGDAQYYIGLMFWQGYGVKRNDKEALKWFHKAAEQGNWNAKTILGTEVDQKYYDDQWRKNNPPKTQMVDPSGGLGEIIGWILGFGFIVLIIFFLPKMLIQRVIDITTGKKSKNW